MPYIGISPTNGVRKRFTYSATAGQTSFSGSAESGGTLTYKDSLYMDVYQNGVLLKPGTDYTATTGTTVVLVTGASLNDVVEMVVYDVFSVADTVAASTGGTFEGDVTTAGTFIATGDTAAGDGAAIGFTSAEGLILTGQGSTSDVTIKNDADATVFSIATGTTTGTFAGTVLAKTDTDTSNTGNVTLDFTANQNFVLTLTGNVTLDNPTTEQVGQSGFIVLIQDGTGSRTLSLGTDYESIGGAGITLSSAASATDIIPYVVAASNRILLGAPQLAFS